MWTGSMGYKLSSGYRWYQVPNEPKMLAKVYYIEGIPYEFDEVTQIQKDNPEIISEADRNKALHADDVFKKSDYLIAEMIHPLLFEVEIENPEELPNDYAA
jgi:hypothetical protein